ncbi:gas vesicle protein K [Roseibacterium sp. SDUM158017]|uniref:gas vesicle protein K n=1 Tax=Roseicyclus salinarum TaxID=3036773 RepID=UPI0024158099|nr:gas vesicle protein K [Roseibacterium sp. SDUM158017]MDG4648415.1 gas vesicle protein K [Roseibacterium sp. SDUM158017]
MMIGDTEMKLGPDDIARALGALTDPAGRVRIEPETVEQDLARLVLALMEFLRQLMETQAIRRMENGTLSTDQEEALGRTLMRSEAAIHDMAARFGLAPGDLSIGLGPLGRSI